MSSLFGKPTVLMCPPGHYGIEYSINPWMRLDQPADRVEANQQWQALHDLLLHLGVDVRLMTAVENLPDLVFTANAGLICGETAIVSRFRHRERQGEVPHDSDWLRQSRFQIREIPEGLVFEGAGDALFCGETLYAGYLIRSDINALNWVGDVLGCRLLPLQLVDRQFYHLDTCFCPLTAQAAIYYPSAFDDYAQRVIQDNIPQLIEVAPGEAAHFACNAVVIGKDVILAAECPQLERDLQRCGFATHSVRLDQFIKAGGSAKCLTLRLDGEEAADWSACNLAEM